MSTSRTALLFPGQGAYLPGVLRAAAQVPEVRAILDAVESVGVPVGGFTASALLTEPDAPSADVLAGQSPESLDLAILAMDLAAQAILGELGVRADVLAGHSFGELAAVTVAGALTVRDAARFVRLRWSVFGEVPGPSGTMCLVAVDRRRADHLVGLADDPDLAVAVTNGPEECVISGPATALVGVENVAQALGVRAARVPAARPFHNPAFAATGRLLAQRTALLPVEPPCTPVYSAILNRYLTTRDDVHELFACHLVQPVDFYEGLRRLHHYGTRHFVEAGARGILTRLAHSALPPGITTVAPFDRRRSREELAGLFGDSAAQPETVGAADRSWPPDRTDSEPVSEPADAPAATAPEAPAVTTDNGGQALPSVDQLAAELRTTYAEFLGFPTEMLTDSVDLEADLGVDSIKQVTLFSKLAKRYELDAAGLDVRVTSYTTLPAIANLLHKLASNGSKAR
ncbi:acyltransferase domain-containing protein [Actinomycetota bacterium Odt1-20B]